jgi:hypothetical protein
MRALLRILLSALLLTGPLLLAGCATHDEPANASARPWNTPKYWESGVPSSLTERR